MLPSERVFGVTSIMLLDKPFGQRPHLFLPVIHLPHGEIVGMESVDTAVKAGADGVFLINQGMSPPQVLAFGALVRAKYPNLWVGLNILGGEPVELLSGRDYKNFKGVWSDDCRADDVLRWETEAEDVTSARKATGRIYFGGVAFKYKKPVHGRNLKRVCERATEYVDVLTTSGVATGVAADTPKVENIRRYVGDHYLALASGVSIENVKNFLPLVDAFLVASKIESYFGVLDPYATSKLSELIHI